MVDNYLLFYIAEAPYRNRGGQTRLAIHGGAVVFNHHVIFSIVGQFCFASNGVLISSYSDCTNGVLNLIVCVPQSFFMIKIEVVET